MHPIEFDWMHVVDVGILQPLMGNIYYELWVTVGGDEEGLAFIMVLVRKCSKALGMECPIGSLTGTMIKRDSKPPKLRSYCSLVWNEARLPD